MHLLLAEKDSEAYKLVIEEMKHNKKAFGFSVKSKENKVILYTLDDVRQANTMYIKYCGKTPNVYSVTEKSEFFFSAKEINRAWKEINNV